MWATIVPIHNKLPRSFVVLQVDGLKFVSLQCIYLGTAAKTFLICPKKPIYLVMENLLESVSYWVKSN